MDEENLELYNQPLASFTFGKESLNNSLPKENPKHKISNNLIIENPLQLNNPSTKNQKPKKNNLKMEKINNNNYFENNSAQNYNIITGELYELTFGKNNNVITNPNNNEINNSYKIKLNNINNILSNNIYSILINPEGINDSYIFSVIYSIHHMKLFEKYIINDLYQQMQKKKNNSLILSNLRQILIQMDKNKYINISNFRNNLFNLFQNHRKFILEQPDDPSDLLFALINSIHSFSINYPLNEISDGNCEEKCFSHKFLWLDLSRIDICKCSGTSKRLFSNHNYITDIPMSKIFNLIKIKSRNKQSYSLYESNQKLFEYYTLLISKMKMNCPVNGQRCPINKTFHKLHLANSPSYLIFNLEQDFNEYNLNYSFTALNILKNLILIPNRFDIWNLFELNSKKNKNDFDFIGCILFKITKTYSCAFKNKKGLIIYYSCNDIQKENLNSDNDINNGYDNNIIEFVSYYDFVVFCIKSGLIPVMLFYQGSLLSPNVKNKNIINYNEYLQNEQIIALEKLCINIDSLYNILQNSLRKKENLIHIKKKNKIDKAYIDNNILNTEKSNILINEYICPSCNSKNNVSDNICIKCNYNNSEYLSKKITLKNFPTQKVSQNFKKSQIIPSKIKPLRLIKDKYQKSQDNINMNNDKKKENKINNILNKRKKYSVSPDIKLKNNDKYLEKYNFETNPEKNEKYLLNLPIPFFRTKRTNREQKYFLNKTEINNDDNTNKKMNFNKLDIIKMIHKSPKIKKVKLMQNNLYNITRHKKVLSSKEKFDILKTYKSNSNINNKRNNNKIKSYTISRTLISNIKKNNTNFDTEIEPNYNTNMRKNVNIKYQYDKLSNKISKSNKNMPVYVMHYSYNDIYLEQKNKKNFKS